jgi:hypothetical protein
MSLVPERDGSLQVDVRDGVVTLTGTQCRHAQGEDARKPKGVAQQILAEVHMTILNSRCQITWTCVVAGEGDRRE